MNRRVVLSGLLGGLAMFAWSSIAHMVLPLGETGVKQISSNEPALLNALRSSVNDSPGLYTFPAMDSPTQSMADYSRKLASNPSGILVYTPPGANGLAPRQFIAEFAVEFLEALLIAFLLTRSAASGFAARFVFVAVCALAISLWTNVSYWNWYSFPAVYTVAYTATQFIGVLCGGLVAIFMLKPRASSQRRFAQV